MNKSESKYFNTALCMDAALISLLKVKDLEYITIKELCEKAGVNRSTFYLHYESIADLVEEALENTDRRFLSYFSEEAQGIADRIESADLSELVLITQDYLEPYLRFVSENKDIYRAAFRNPRETQRNIKYRYIKKHIVEPILKRFHVPDIYWRYYIAYYIDGIMAIIKEWLETDCKDSVEMVAAVIEECVRPSTGEQERPRCGKDATPTGGKAQTKVE